MSDAIYNGSASILYYYMCRSSRLLQERGEPVLAIRISWISRQWVLVFEQRHFLRFHNAVEERVFILKSYLKNDVLRPL